MSTQILILGSGGREHALAWKLAQSSIIKHIFVCPGNPGSAKNQKTSNLDLPLIHPYKDIVDFAVNNKIDLVVPGPEDPLVLGVEKCFRDVGIPVFGPTQLAARMEGSKAFSKLQDAANYVQTCGHPVVLKASGLAGGKGVLIPSSIDEALQGLRSIMVDNAFGSAGDEIVIEELLEGPEISVLAFSDGYTIVPLPAAQDHKRIGEGDTGLNTGGMGAYAPAPVATPAIMDRIMTESLRPTIDGMRKEGFPFVGLLFTDFMLTADGPKVLEYNVRFGDPETEALMLLLSDDVDLAAVLIACAERHLDSVQINTRPGFSVSVILVSGGYPESYAKGKPIQVGKVPSDVVVFHCGTSMNGNDLVTSGGRVMAVTCSAPTLEQALAQVYTAVDKISFEGKFYRRDIAHRALTSSSQAPSNGLTYAQAGVSVDAGNAFVEAIKPYVRATKRSGADVEIGGFGGIFDLKATGYKDPVLVSGTDGVGTKLRIAVDAGIHHLVGIDLVAMSVNDLLVQGAEPLYFLDYYGCSKLDVATAADVIKGIAQGCQQAGCALVGGETAEMPGMYQNGDYDLAGFAVGAVERSSILPRADIMPGDILLGIASSGIHSNGFSLVRKVIEMTGLSYSTACPWDDQKTLALSLLEPTRIYVKQVLPAVHQGLLKGMSHITGGGFIENIPRVLPKGMGAFIDASTWQLPPVFRFLMQRGGIAPLEMARTFNNGIGLVLIVGREDVDRAVQVLQGTADAAVYRIGEVTDKSGVEMRNLECWSPQ